MNCPSCGAQVGFRSERAPYAVCSSCQTMVVRKDVNLEAVGKIAECQPDGSPVQIGTSGVHNGKAFEVLGRIQLTYGEGFWNEWFLRFSDGSEGWLGEALGQFFINSQMSDNPDLTDLQLGSLVEYDGEDWVVLDRKKVQVSSVEGELPYLIASKDWYLTVDMRNKHGEGLTVDYSDDQPTTYRGSWLAFDELSLTNLNRDENPMIAVPASEVKPIKCSSCGAPHEITGPGRAELFVCQYCDAALDVRNPELKQVDQLFKGLKKLAERAVIPLGTLAQLPKAQYKVIGMMENATTVDGITYKWSDYLLYNHLHGYLWVNENNGHYTLFEQLYAVPIKRYGFTAFKRPVGDPPDSFVLLGKEKYKHFSTAGVKVTTVMGEFYWRVKAGDRSLARDYVSPPTMISASTGQSDITWTKGRYLERSELGTIFPGVTFPLPTGVAPAQPNPYTVVRKLFFPIKAAGYILAFLLIVSGIFLPDGQPVASDLALSSSRARPADPPTAKATFKIDAEGSRTVKITLECDLKDNWVDGWLKVPKASSRSRRQSFKLAKLKGAGQNKRVFIVHSVPAGRNVNLEVYGKFGPPGPAPPIVPVQEDYKAADLPPMKVKVEALPGRQNFSSLFYMWLLLLLPNWLLKRKQSSFETKRWYESDYG